MSDSWCGIAVGWCAATAGTRSARPDSGTGAGWAGEVSSSFLTAARTTCPDRTAPTLVGTVWLWRTSKEVRERIEAVLCKRGVTVLDKEEPADRRFVQGPNGP